VLIFLTKTLSMKKLQMLLVGVAIFFAISKADGQSKPLFQPLEISISEGVVSSNQLCGIDEGPLIGYMSFPYKITGAAFASFYKYASPRISVGITLGLDNQKGDLSYGNPRVGSIAGRTGGGSDGISGVYNRKMFTVAAEFRYNYYIEDRCVLYCLAGIGYTTGNIDYSFFKDAKFQDQLYGPNGLVPSNPSAHKVGRINAQVTPFGIRRGGKLACFFEFGYGYKGMFVGGVSCKL
jgi:hypothetical protein